MVLKGGCGDIVRKVWWSCKEGLAVLFGGVEVLRVGLCCQEDVVVLQGGSRTQLGVSALGKHRSTSQRLCWYLSAIPDETKPGEWAVSPR